MDPVSVGFWGAFFGAAGLSLLAALRAFRRSARRVAWTGSLSALVSGLYVLVFLGWWPAGGDSLARWQAQAAAVAAAILGLLLFWLLGAIRPSQLRRVIRGMGLLLAAVLALGWWLPPRGALALSAAWQAVIAGAGLVLALRAARRGAAAGRPAVAGVAFMCITIVGLWWHVLGPQPTAWPVHAISALAAIGYTACMGAAMWARYAYLIEVRQAMEHGPGYDPVTRMLSHGGTLTLVHDAFTRARREGASLGLLVVSLANLDALERLHGRAACQHALFICASRLRRSLPPGAHLGRLGPDAFVLVKHRPAGAEPLMALAHELAQRLSRPVVVGTSGDLEALEASDMRWVAKVGVGVLLAPPDMMAPTAIQAAKAMSRTAWSYASRVACYDPEVRRIAELVPEAGR